MKFRCFINGLFSLNNSPNIHGKRYGKAHSYPHDVQMLFLKGKKYTFHNSQGWKLQKVKMWFLEVSWLDESCIPF